jgi:hypothetical protein
VPHPTYTAPARLRRNHSGQNKSDGYRLYNCQNSRNVRPHSSRSRGRHSRDLSGANPRLSRHDRWTHRGPCATRHAASSRHRMGVDAVSRAPQETQARDRTISHLAVRSSRQPARSVISITAVSLCRVLSPYSALRLPSGLTPLQPSSSMRLALPGVMQGFDGSLAELYSDTHECILFSHWLNNGFAGRYPRGLWSPVRNCPSLF